MNVHSARLGIGDFRASSAGTRAVIGHPIHSSAAEVLERMGGDASDFSARQFNAKIAQDADLILTMTRAHRDVVLESAPRLLRRTFTLREAARLSSLSDDVTMSDLAALRPYLSAAESLDIADPIGKGPLFFSEVGEQIRGDLLRVFELFRRSSDA